MPEAAVAVLALQGGFERHVRALETIGARAYAARTEKEIAAATHLVLPGGESTTMLNLLAEEGLEPALVDFHASGRPILATCAGVILLAREVRSPAQHSLALLDAVVERNAYGRQLASFAAPLAIDALGPPPFDAVFIRAPIIREVGAGVTILATQDTPVLVRDRNVLAATFHPELSADDRLHRLFLDPR